jgi:hypothetical protein
VSGLYYFRNRDYSPTLGRWVSMDPIRYQAGDVNLYRGVGNCPIINVDPLGLDDSDEVMKKFSEYGTPSKKEWDIIIAKLYGNKNGDSDGSIFQGYVQNAMLKVEKPSYRAVTVGPIAGLAKIDEMKADDEEDKFILKGWVAPDLESEEDPLILVEAKAQTRKTLNVRSKKQLESFALFLTGRAKKGSILVVTTFDLTPKSIGDIPGGIKITDVGIFHAYGMVKLACGKEGWSGEFIVQKGSKISPGEVPVDPLPKDSPAVKIKK